MTSAAEAEPELMVVRCERCGDTFPIERDASAACRSCGGDDLAPASEPLL